MRGALLDEVLRVPTRGRSPRRRSRPACGHREPHAVHGSVGLAFPTVARRGVAMTAANIDRRWIGTDARRCSLPRIHRPVAF